MKLAVRNLTVKDLRGVTMVDGVSFDVRAGESSALPASPVTASRSCWRRSPASARRSGTVELDGQPIHVTGEVDPGELRDRGLAHVPEDRHHVGLVLPFEENENSILGYQTTSNT